jgi:acetyl esterase/lipase
MPRYRRAWSDDEPSDSSGPLLRFPGASGETIRPTNNRTSIVIDPTGRQIQCGQLRLATYSNVVYSTPATNGRATRLEMDIQVPKTAGRKPLVIFITGGGFVLADDTANLNQRTYVADHGYVVASITYRTVLDGGTWRDSLADVKSAIRYLRAHARTYEIDPSKVAVWGQSAGGYLASFAGTTNGDKRFDAGQNLNHSSDVQAVVDEFGPSDLSKVAADYDKAAQTANYQPGNSLAEFVFGPGTKLSIEDDPAAVHAADPTTYISSKTPPFIELQGSHDQLVSPSQTLLMHTALRAKGIPSTRYVVKGANHGDLTVPGLTASAGHPWSTRKVMNIIVDFLAKQLRT